MKELMLAILKEINKTETVTRLRYKIGDHEGIVEDFSSVTNKNYMSENLLNALANRQTLTSVQEEELSNFIVEKELTLSDKQLHRDLTTEDLIKYTWDKAKTRYIST